MEHKAAAGDSGRAGARDDGRAARLSGEAGAAGGERYALVLCAHCHTRALTRRAVAQTKQRVVRRRERADAAAGDSSGRGAGVVPGLEALDDLPLELMGDDEEAESQLFSLLQRLRFAGTQAGGSFGGFDLCELALAMGVAQPEDTEADAAANQGEANGGEKAAAAEEPLNRGAAKRDRTAARQRARFVKALLVSSLAVKGGEPEARGDDSPP